MIRQTTHFKHEMILPKVPADFLILFKGITRYAECKSSKDGVGFPIANIKQHQLDFSEEIERAGAPYYFIICKREPRNNILYIIEARKLREMIKVLKSGKLIKSKILWSVLQTNAIHAIPKSRGCVYDLKCFFK
jgi:penicillin-binding protein-related factor A (putative recombinase)